MENCCDNKPNLRLYKTKLNDYSINNILNLYKTLRGKENNQKRLFLKTLVYCSINGNTTIRGEMLSNRFYQNLNVNIIETLLKEYSESKIYRVFGCNMHEEIGKLI